MKSMPAGRKGGVTMVAGGTHISDSAKGGGSKTCIKPKYTPSSPGSRIKFDVSLGTPRFAASMGTSKAMPVKKPMPKAR